MTDIKDYFPLSLLQLRPLGNLATTTQCLLFADNLKTSSKVDCDGLQADLDRIVGWSHSKKLFFTIDKFYYMTETEFLNNLLLTSWKAKELASPHRCDL